MSGVLTGEFGWGLTRDKEGHRDYKIKQRVRTTDSDDGPATVLSTPGLPLIGAPWAYGNDSDPWAFCWPTLTITKDGPKEEKGTFWIVENTFSTKPLSRCQDESIEDPLLEPDRVSGSFVKRMKEAIKDRHGDPIQSSSHERFRGKMVEVNDDRHSVSVEQNIADLDLDVSTSMQGTVNDATLWGLAPRKILLANVSWSRKLYGVCTFYYTRTLDFEIDFDTFNRVIPDWGTKVLAPLGNQYNPADFVMVKDLLDENAPDRVPLDGAGNMVAAGANPFEHVFEIEDESNFLLLGVPTSF